MMKRILFVVLVLYMSSCKWLPEVGKVSLSDSSVNLKVGGTRQLSATVEPAAAEYETILWTSSDPSVVSVTNGIIFARKIGSAQITASAAGVTSSPCQVTVSKTPVSNVSLDKSSVSILEGESLSLKETVSPSDATNGSVTWSTGNSKVATVSTTGIITAVEEGETTITAKSDDNGITATCKVIVTAEYVDFPDPNFRKYMVENFDLNKNGKISLTEAKRVVMVQVSTHDIETLTGIEALSNLKTLSCIGDFDRSSTRPGFPGNGKLKSIDISKNILLEKLDCKYNSLKAIDVSCNVNLRELVCLGNSIEYIDITNNPLLTHFNCNSNFVTSIDVSHNQELKSFDIRWNKITNLDVTKNSALTSLSCDSNQLTSLDVSKNTALTSLYCGSNQLTSLDVSKNTALSRLDCESNQLTSLDVSKNTALTSLSCYSNQLMSLDVSKNTSLKSLSCGSNQLTTLDVTKNTALTHLYCSSNQLTILDVSENTALTYLQCSPMSSLKTLYVAPEQSIDGVTINRNNGYVPYGTSIVTK